MKPYSRWPIVVSIWQSRTAAIRSVFAAKREQNVSPEPGEMRFFLKCSTGIALSNETGLRRSLLASALQPCSKQSANILNNLRHEYRLSCKIIEDNVLTHRISRCNEFSSASCNSSLIPTPASRDFFRLPLAVNFTGAEIANIELKCLRQFAPGM